MEHLSLDINHIKTCYEQYNLIDNGKNIPNTREFVFENCDVMFNCKSYNFKEMQELIDAACKEFSSIRVEIISIDCLNLYDRCYSCLSIWHIRKMSGEQITCPKLEILYIKDNKIVKAIGVMNNIS